LKDAVEIALDSLKEKKDSELSENESERDAKRNEGGNIEVTGKEDEKDKKEESIEESEYEEGYVLSSHIRSAITRLESSPFVQLIQVCLFLFVFFCLCFFVCVFLFVFFCLCFFV
jgi:hypothetical protein